MPQFVHEVRNMIYHPYCKTSLTRVLRFTALTFLLAHTAASQAAIRFGDPSEDGLAGGMTMAELTLIVWDRKNEVAYVKDLGVNVDNVHFASVDPASNLFVYGQQDTGYQRLWDPLNRDTNFQSFLAKSSNPSDQVWAVVGGSLNPNGGFGGNFGDSDIFMTLKHTEETGRLDPQYKDLTDTSDPNSRFGNGAIANVAGNISTYVGNVSNAMCARVATCAADFSDNRSLFVAKGQLGYPDPGLIKAGVNLGLAGYDVKAINIFNPVGASSWFYALAADAAVETETPVVIDEFDNSAHDAYWGLGIDPSNNNYILSYTLEADPRLVQPKSLNGLLLRTRTDFAASYGHTRLIEAPEADTLNLSLNVAAPAVPEPSSWAFMGLGLSLLAVRAGRRARD